MKLFKIKQRQDIDRFHVWIGEEDDHLSCYVHFKEKENESCLYFSVNREEALELKEFIEDFLKDEV